MQVARVGLYDRNRAMKAVRRKAVQALKKKPEEELTEEEKVIAARAKEIRDAAAARSIQPSKEQLAEEAKGVGRSYERAQALPEGLWEELKDKYRWVLCVWWWDWFGEGRLHRFERLCVSSCSSIPGL
jgi:hypothetical protein